jgi:hypothetical protein
MFTGWLNRYRNTKSDGASGPSLLDANGGGPDLFIAVSAPVHPHHATLFLQAK